MKFVTKEKQMIKKQKVQAEADDEDNKSKQGFDKDLK